MDEFKPEDELKPDPSDRRTGRSRQSSERSERTERGEPQINFDDIELDDTDDRRPTRAQKARNEEPEIEEELDESEDETVDEERVERRPRKRKKAASKPASRQYMMMGVGILVLLLLIIGIGSALKAPRPLPAIKPRLARRVLILQAMRPIRPMACSQRREPRLRKILSRMFLCRRSLLRRLKGKPRRQRMVSNVLKCRVT